MADRHAKQRDRASRRAAKKLSEVDERGDYECPPVDECEAWDYTHRQNATTRVTTHIRVRDGQLVGYALMHDVLDREEWRAVTRIDCKHGHVHQHFFRRDGTERGHSPVHLVPLHSEKDVANSYDSSYSLVADNVEQNERAWRDD